MSPWFGLISVAGFATAGGILARTWRAKAGSG
jgi:hypothetical protein